MTRATTNPTTREAISAKNDVIIDHGNAIFEIVVIVVEAFRGDVLAKCKIIVEGETTSGQKSQ
jgi:hypothetical protein